MAKKNPGGPYRPSSPADILFMAAQKLHKAGNIDGALVAYGKVLRLLPNHADALNNTGALHYTQGRLTEAETVYAKLLTLRPSSQIVLRNLAVVYKAQGRVDEAMELYQRTLEIDGNDLRSLVDIGVILFENAKYEESIVFWRRAAALAPNDPSVLADFGLCLRWVYLPEEAEVNLRRAMSMRVTAMANNALGITLKLMSRFEEASVCFQDAVRLDPTMHEAAWNESTTRLLFGQYDVGWDQYEIRWKVKSLPSPRRQFDRPQWQGEPLEGKRLLIHWEQGLGDTLQFIRYAAQVKRLGATVIVLSQPELYELLRIAPNIDEVVVATDSLPPYDAHIPVMSLPRIFKTRLNTIPSDTPYLMADATRVERWAPRCQVPANGALRIGLIWAGGNIFGDDIIRSPGLAAFLPLLEVPGVVFHLLQVGARHDDLKTVTLPAGALVIDHGPDIADFADTAAVMTQMDLIISSCTASVHLAGALRRPTWVVLPKVGDWRWLLEREDSPWYPEMRLFRQDAMGREWAPVVARVKAALSELIAHRITT